MWVPPMAQAEPAGLCTGSAVTLQGTSRVRMAGRDVCPYPAAQPALTEERPIAREVLGYLRVAPGASGEVTGGVWGRTCLCPLTWTSENPFPLGSQQRARTAMRAVSSDSPESLSAQEAAVTHVF